MRWASGEEKEWKVSFLSSAGCLSPEVVSPFRKSGVQRGNPPKPLKETALSVQTEKGPSSSSPENSLRHEVPLVLALVEA